MPRPGDHMLAAAREGTRHDRADAAAGPGDDAALPGEIDIHHAYKQYGAARQLAWFNRPGAGTTPPFGIMQIFPERKPLPAPGQLYPAAWMRYRSAVAAVAGKQFLAAACLRDARAVEHHDPDADRDARPDSG
jgi:hypothetical protein